MMVPYRRNFNRCRENTRQSLLLSMMLWVSYHAAAFVFVFVFMFVVVGVVVSADDPQQRAAVVPVATATTRTDIPLQFDAPFGSYPNLLNITEEERNSFSPVVVFPKRMLIAKKQQ